MRKLERLEAMSLTGDLSMTDAVQRPDDAARAAGGLATFVTPSTRGSVSVSVGGKLSLVSAAVILLLTVLFNPLLSIVNGHLFPLTGGIVAAFQAALVLGALFIGAAGRDRPSGWLAITLAIVASFLAISLARGSLDPKPLGEVLVIPAFILLGARLNYKTLVTVVIMLQTLLTGVGLWELADPAGFGEVFRVAEYYIGTRGFSADQFWAGNGLFVSSQRPGGRLLLGHLNLHRGSSLFLEPVSLGNWIVVILVFVMAFWTRLGWAARLFLIMSNCVLLVVCDGRLAMVLSLALLIYLPFSRHVPERVSAVYLLVALAGLALLSSLGLLLSTGDDLLGRLRVGLEAMMNLDVRTLLGLGSREHLMVDAGYVYVIQTQSFLVGLLLWFGLTLTSLGDTPSSRIFKHGTMIFIAACLLVSYSVLTIKTAGLLWALYGYFLAENWRAAARRREEHADEHPVAPNAGQPFASWQDRPAL